MDIGEEYPLDMVVVYVWLCEPGDGLSGGPEPGTLPGLGDWIHSSVLLSNLRFPP